MNKYPTYYDIFSHIAPDTITITGEISKLLKGLEHTNILYKDIIGIPITNQDGKVIGKITTITDEYWFADIDTQEWLHNMGIPANIML